MATARLTGLLGFVMYSSTPGASGFSDEWLGVKSYEIGISAERPDATGYDSGGWRQVVRGLRGFSGSVEAVFDTALPGLFTVGEDPPVLSNGQMIRLRLALREIGDPATAVDSFDFDAVITDVSYRVRVDDTIVYTIRFQGTGPIDLTLNRPLA